MCQCADLPPRLSISFSCSKLTPSSSPSSTRSVSAFWLGTVWLRKTFFNLITSSSLLTVNRCRAEEEWKSILHSVALNICQRVGSVIFQYNLKKVELLNKDKIMFNCLSPTHPVGNTKNNIYKKCSAILLILRPAWIQYSISNLKRMKHKNAESV